MYGSEENMWAFEDFDNFTLLFGEGVVVIIDVKIKASHIVIILVIIVHFEGLDLTFELNNLLLKFRYFLILLLKFFPVINKKLLISFVIIQPGRLLSLEYIIALRKLIKMFL